MIYTKEKQIEFIYIKNDNNMDFGEPQGVNNAKQRAIQVLIETVLFEMAHREENSKGSKYVH